MIFNFCPDWNKFVYQSQRIKANLLKFRSYFVLVPINYYVRIPLGLERAGLVRYVESNETLFSLLFLRLHLQELEGSIRPVICVGWASSTGNVKIAWRPLSTQAA